MLPAEGSLTLHPRLSMYAGSLEAWRVSIAPHPPCLGALALWWEVGGGSPRAAGLGLRPWPSGCRTPGGGSRAGPSHATLGLKVQALVDGGE